MAEDSKFLLEEEREFKRTYKLSLWWVQHRAGIKRIGYGLFMLFDAVLLLFVLWTFLDTYAVSYDEERRAVEQIVVQGKDLRDYTKARAAADLVIEDTRVFSIGEKLHDFYAMALNPNAYWWVEFDYQFTFGESKTDLQHAIFLPGQQKPLVELGLFSETTIRSAELAITNINWHRFDTHALGNVEEWLARRSSIEISDARYQTETINNKTIGVSTFRVVNKTAYSFFNPTFHVLLKQGSQVVGVNRATVASLESLEEKEVSLNWFGTLPGVTTVEVLIDVNFLDPSVYQREKEASTGDVRTRSSEE